MFSDDESVASEVEILWNTGPDESVETVPLTTEPCVPCSCKNKRITQQAASTVVQNMSRLESQDDTGSTNKHSARQRQLLCACVINCVSFLQGASVPTSSVILHSLQDRHTTNTTDCQHSTTAFQLQDFTVSKESGSWVGEQ